MLGGSFVVGRRACDMSEMPLEILLLRWSRYWAVLAAFRDLLGWAKPLAEMDERERKIAANEALFRVVNAEIVELEGERESRSIVCECGDAACAELLEITAAEYSKLRADPTSFAVKHGHANAEIEEVVVRGSGYDTVRKKTGAAAAVLLAEDPGPL